jgi:crotonobetainyl-CoA:carnitine CoA-transferase CaiB-like acyl-CoA transferase
MEPWFWHNLCEQLGCTQYASEQFNEDFFEEMFAFLRSTLKQKTRDEWFTQFAQDEICATPVYGIDEAIEDPHNISRDMVVELEDEEFGTIRQIGIAPKFSATPGEVKTLPPDPGQHSEEILKEAGLSAEDITHIIQQNQAHQAQGNT